MHRIDSVGTAVAIPTPGVVGGTVGYFTEGDPGTGTPATRVSADWLNAVQEEILAVLTRAGVTADKTVRTQLRDSIETLVRGGGSQSVVFADSPVTADGVKKSYHVSTAGGNVQINLPAAAGVTGARITVVKTTGDANTVTVEGDGAETINGELNQVIDTQWTALTFLSIGTGWVLV